MKNLLMNSVVFAPADEGAGGGGGSEGEGTSNAAESTGTILSGKVDDADAGGSPKEGSSDWKEYVPDSAKSAEENATLKAAHDGTKPKEEGKADEVTDPADTVPEDGKYTIALEGDIQLDEGLLEKASPVMKEIGLTNAQASRLAGVLAEQRKVEYDSLNERHQKITEDWQKEIKTDKDFGGDNLKDSVLKADRVIATFGDDAFRRDLVELGIGNHPGLFRLLARVGNVLSDDKPLTSETPAAHAKSPEESMYGATTPTTRG